MTNVYVHESTIRITLNFNGVPLLSLLKTTWTGQKAIGKMWMNETKIRLFGWNEKCYDWWLANSAFQHTNLMTIVGTCVAASGSGQLGVINSLMELWIWIQNSFTEWLKPFLVKASFTKWMNFIKFTIIIFCPKNTFRQMCIQIHDYRLHYLIHIATSCDR